jgi:hypothetical protein
MLAVRDQKETLTLASGFRLVQMPLAKWPLRDKYAVNRRRSTPIRCCMDINSRSSDLKANLLDTNYLSSDRIHRYKVDTVCVQVRYGRVKLSWDLMSVLDKGDLNPGGR